MERGRHTSYKPKHPRNNMVMSYLGFTFASYILGLEMKKLAIQKHQETQKKNNQTEHLRQ